MILIAHRGNIDGPNPERENHPEYIRETLDRHYHAEIDVWYKDSKWYLGHDLPQYEVEEDFFSESNLWCHAKNIEALHKMLKEDIHCFWHQEDDVTLTSCGFIWTYPGKELTDNSI